MNLTNAKLANQINAKHVKVVKIRVRASQINASHVKVVKIRVRAKKIVLSARIVTVIVIVPVLFLVQRFLWQMVYGSLLKRLQQENMYRVLMASILYSAHKEPYLALVDVFGRSEIKASTSPGSICSG